jgi:hypothetical protein
MPDYPIPIQNTEKSLVLMNKKPYILVWLFLFGIDLIAWHPGVNGWVYFAGLVAVSTFAWTVLDGIWTSKK